MLHFSHITIKARKSVRYLCLQDCKTLGDHISHMRLTRGFKEIGVTPRLGVNPWILRNCELENTEPSVLYYPTIMDFLGYCPYKRRDTLGKQIMLHRTHQGLSQRDLARIVDVDPGSVSRCEAIDRIVKKKLAK